MPRKAKAAAVEKTIVPDAELYFKTMFGFPTKEEAEAYQATHTLAEGIHVTEVLDSMGKYKHNYNNVGQKSSDLALAQRYHFLLLTRLTMTDASYSKMQTFRMYEAKCREVEEGISAEEVAYLESLPPVEEWRQHTLTLDQLNSFYFKDEPSSNIKQEAAKDDGYNDLIHYDLDGFNDSQKEEMVSLRKRLFQLFERKYGSREKALDALRENVGA